MEFSIGNNGLANKKLEYTYSTGEKVTLKIGPKTLEFSWEGGHLDGLKIDNLEYVCTETRKGQFLLKWHNLIAKSYVTLLIDTQEMQLHGSAIMFYQSEEISEIFDQATITDITDLT